MSPRVRRLIVALVVVAVALWLGSLQGDGSGPAGAGGTDPGVPVAALAAPVPAG